MCDECVQVYEECVCDECVKVYDKCVCDECVKVYDECVKERAHSGISAAFHEYIHKYSGK